MRNMVQVIDGEIKQFRLPEVGELSDGSTVSGYHLQSLDILLSEGWLPLEDIQPEYNEDTQYIINDGFEILEDKVIVKYRIEDIIIETIEPQPSMEDYLLDLDFRISSIELGL
jgi:hypothetical protein